MVSRLKDLKIGEKFLYKMCEYILINKTKNGEYRCHDPSRFCDVYFIYPMTEVFVERYTVDSIQYLDLQSPILD